MVEMRVPSVNFFGMLSQISDALESAREEAQTRRTLAALLDGGFGAQPAANAQPQQAAAPASQGAGLPKFAQIGNLGAGVMTKYDPQGPDRAAKLSEYVENGTVNGINPDFERRALAFLNDNPAGVGIRSGFRSADKQQQLWDAAVAKYGSPEAARKWVAPPGRSKHNHGVALDLSYETPEARKWAHENAAAYGLNFPMSHEPWHVEPLGARGAAVGGASQADTQSGQQVARQAPTQAASLPGVGAGVQPARVSNDMLKSLLMTKGTRPLGLQVMQSMLAPKSSPFDFMTVGENMVRVNKQTGEAQLIPGLGKQADPLAQEKMRADIEKTRAETAVMRPKDDRPEKVKNYDFYRKEEVAAGRTPKSFGEWELESRRAGATNVNVGGGSDKQLFDAVEESAKSANAAATGLASISEARRAVEGGGFFGSGADIRLQLAKVATALGADGRKVTNTETFRSAIAPQIAAMMKATVGSTQISNADREFAAQAAGGSITLDETSIKRLLGIMERAGKDIIDRHNKKLDTIYPDNGKFDRERALFSVSGASGRPAATGLSPGASTTINGVKIERVQ